MEIAVFCACAELQWKRSCRLQSRTMYGACTGVQSEQPLTLYLPTAPEWRLSTACGGTLTVHQHWAVWGRGLFPPSARARGALLGGAGSSLYSWCVMPCGLITAGDSGTDWLGAAHHCCPSPSSLHRLSGVAADHTHCTGTLALALALLPGHSLPPTPNPSRPALPRRCA